MNSLTGAQLQAARRRAGINQTRMGQLIGCSRHAVSYWETKPTITARQMKWGVPNLMATALGIERLPYFCATTRAREDGVLLDAAQSALNQESARQLERITAKAARYRQQCGARTRKGKPCLNLSEAGRARCKFHGGKSTGPVSAQGRQRIADAQRARWIAYRAARA